MNRLLSFDNFLNEGYSIYAKVNKIKDVNILYRMLYDFEEKAEIKKEKNKRIKAKGDHVDDNYYFLDQIDVIKKRIKDLENK